MNPLISNYDVLNTDGEVVDRAARQEARIVHCSSIIFFLFCLLCSCRGHQVAASMCAGVAFAQLLIQRLARKLSRLRLTIHLNLLMSAIGLFCVTITLPHLFVVLLIFPTLTLIASQFLGERECVVWFVANLGMLVLSHVTTYGFSEAAIHPQFDQLGFSLGVVVGAFVLTRQGVECFRKQTNHLLRLSKRLQRKSEVLERLATTDALTGIMNRFHLQERLKECVEDSVSHSSRVALFLIDMDGLCDINDTFGHPTGDKVLVNIASRLKSQFGAFAEVARVGGDEFCIIVDSIVDIRHAQSIAKEVFSSLTAHYFLDEGEFILDSSVGFAVCPDHAVNAQELLAFADTAMFQAREGHVGFKCYEPDMTTQLVEHRLMQLKLSTALEKNDFFVVYQPQVNALTQKVVGVEALLRWRDGNDVVPPYKFIPILEQSREIVPVSKWLIRECCRQQSVWKSKGIDLPISINVSPVQFEDDQFTESIAACLEEFGNSGNNLSLEITEGLLIDDVSCAIKKLNRIKEMGISISVDDFGTGYSSLAYLKQFPIDKLKIDRAFIKDIPEHDDGVIASSIIVLAQSLNLDVLAEGVETEEHLRFLKEHGCHEYQGFYFSRPVDPVAIERLMQQQTTNDAGAVSTAV